MHRQPRGFVWGWVAGAGTAVRHKARRNTARGLARVDRVERRASWHCACFCQKQLEPSESLPVLNRNTQVMVLAGAAALAGFGYTFARRSRSARSKAVAGREQSATDAMRGADAQRVVPAATRGASEGTPWQDEERISSAPDALDVALDLDGVFEGESANGSELTARPHDSVPAPRSGDDEDAPAPEDLGRSWLVHAAESESSLGAADTLPDVESLPKASDELGEESDAEDTDETTAEYIRKHRLSSPG